MFGIIWRMPWLVYVVFALVTVTIGYAAYQDALKTNEARKIALEGQAPELIDAGTITRDSFTAADEINVSAQIISDAIYTVPGKRTLGRKAHVLFALSPKAENINAEVRAVFLIDTKYSLDQFFEKFDSGTAGSVSEIFNINGMRKSSRDGFDRLVKRVARQENLTLNQGVQLIEPFMEGREAALQPKSETFEFGVFGLIALGLLLYGAIRYFIKRKKPQAEPTQEA